MNHPRGQGTVRRAVMLCLAVLVVVGAVWYFVAGRGWNTASSRQLLEARNVGIGQMENLQLDEAEASWVSLSERIPNELLPTRNLAITRLLWLQTSKEGDVAPVKEAFERMLELEQQSAESLWLYVQMLMHPRITQPSVERDQKAQELLTLAAEKAPGNPLYWYGVYEVGRLSSDDQVSDVGELALKKAWGAQRDNIWVINELLNLQSRNQDPDIIETLSVAQEVLEPLESTIQRGGKKAGVKQFLDEALAAAKESDWSGVRKSVFRLKNYVATTDISQRDYAIVMPHPLELTVFDYSDDLLAQMPKTLARPAPEIDFTFQRFDAAISLPDNAKPIRAVQMADFTLDGSTELLVLTESQFYVLKRRGADWTVELEVELPNGMRGFLLGDLDQDRLVLKRGQASEQAGTRTLESVASQTEPTPALSTASAPPEGLEPSKTISTDLPTEESPSRAACHEADLDLVVFGEQGVLVFRNSTEPDGPCVVQLVPQADSLKRVDQVRAAAMADVDHDADLDLILATTGGVHIWSLTGGSLEYESINAWSVLPSEDQVLDCMTIVDWDRDADIDVILSDSTGETIGLLENIRHARFIWRNLDDDGAASWRGGATLAAYDATGNVSWDVLAAGQSGIHLLPTVTQPQGSVTLQPARVVQQQPVEGAVILDADNDGHQDVAAWSTAGLRFHRGLPNAAFGSFKNLGEAPLPIDGAVACGCGGDLDNDGDLDLVLGTEKGLVGFTNQGGNQNQWISVQAMGTQDNAGRANHTGIGSLLELKAGDHYQARMVTSQTTHFGLGTIAEPEILRIVWTNGVPQAVIRPATQLTLCEPMVLKGSCPYVYTWNGERFEFHTDCLWAAPIGLQVADGVLAPSRPWEYLKIPGEKIKADTSGNYRLQLTEELWEIAYFDKVELIAVDHPETVEVYSNEKVGPPTIAEYKVHTVSNRRKPVVATDQRGRDVLPLLLKRDGDFVRAFDQRIHQGLTEPHYIELHLGELGEPSQLTLFLTGWIYPTDTSLNLAFSQDSETDGPRLPSVWAPDENGKWREVSAYMGFPGGKTKTIAIDLSKAFTAGDYRVRIATTSEIYWDEAFFTADDPPAPLRSQTLAVQQADLHYRGVSARHWHKPHAPEQFDYSIVQTAPVWPPVRGAFTRYGDVTRLLLEADDQMAILGSGDEMTLTFKAPPPPKPGWKRDFMLHCVGWDKDADLNTYFGQSVEPLPFNAMKDYPYADDEQFPDTTAHREYQRTYQTRHQSRLPFWRWVKEYGAP